MNLRFGRLTLSSSLHACNISNQHTSIWINPPPNIFSSPFVLKQTESGNQNENNVQESEKINKMVVQMVGLVRDVRLSLEKGDAMSDRSDARRR